MNKQIEDALKNAGLLEYFNRLAPSHKEEYLSWISEAKKEDTKVKRIEKMIEMLRSKLDR